MKLLVVLMPILVLISCSSGISYKREIVRIEIASIPYRTKRIIALKPWEIYDHEDAFRVEIANPNDLGYIQGRLDLSTPLREGWNCMDARVVAVIQWNNRAIDTLTFGEMYQTYGDRCCPVDSLLLRRISLYLPSRHQEEIDYYLRVHLPRVKW